MRVSVSPKSKPMIEGTREEKLRDLVKGRISVGKFHKATEKALVPFYIGRIGGRNVGEVFETAEEAFIEIKKIKTRWIKELQVMEG